MLFDSTQKVSEKKAGWCGYYMPVFCLVGLMIKWWVLITQC